MLSTMRIQNFITILTLNYLLPSGKVTSHKSIKKRHCTERSKKGNGFLEGQLEMFGMDCDVRQEVRSMGLGIPMGKNTNND